MLIATNFRTIVFIWVDFNSPERVKYHAICFEKLRQALLFSLAFSTHSWSNVSQYNWSAQIIWKTEILH